MVCAVGALALAASAQFLAPSLSYEIRDRSAEWLSGQRGRTYRIALGAAAGSYFRLGEVLNAHLRARSGYALELVATAGVPENVGALLDPARGIHLATIESSSDEAVKADGIYGVAAVGTQYFFVVVPSDSPVREVRDLRGAINPGVRASGQAPTLGEKVLDYYGLLTASQGQPPAVSVVRPQHGSILKDFAAGHMTAATRTQFLHADLIDDVLNEGRYRLTPIPDHEALARALPGTAPGFIPAGAYGPGRRVPESAVPTLTVALLIVARSDLPGRVVQRSPRGHLRSAVRARHSAAADRGDGAQRRRPAASSCGRSLLPAQRAGDLRPHRAPVVRRLDRRRHRRSHSVRRPLPAERAASRAASSAGDGAREARSVAARDRAERDRRRSQHPHCARPTTC